MGTVKKQVWMMGLAMALCVGAAAYVSRATSMAPMASPPAAPVIASVDMDRIIEGLTERKDKEASLSASVDEAKKHIDALATELKADKAKLDNEPDGVNKLTLAKALREKSIRYEFENRNQERVLNETRGEMLRDMNSKITETVGRMAKKLGYHLVLASDQRVPILSNDMEAVTRAISLKRMLYVDPTLDITADVIEQMNNEYATSGGKPAASATQKP